MNRVVVHNSLEPTLTFSSTANKVIIHHVEPRLTVSNSNHIVVKDKTTKKVKMITTAEKITVKQRDNKKNLKAVR